MYLALARKYRPQKFAELIGQNSISRTIQNALRMGKVYPAMIFSGMKGVGKTSTARILAKALNCERGPTDEPCNECPTCHAITEDASADYLEIDGASNNGVSEVRSLRETVKYKPMKNRFRVVVIDEVHMLSGAAWNALLKTIEEPPEHTVFIMATTDFHKIPATIVSRCQHFEFKRIPLEIIKNVLEDICRKEQVVVSDYSLYLIARSGEGSLRDAKKILDQAIALSNGDVNDRDVVEILGIIDEEVFIHLTDCVLTQNRQGIIEQIFQLAERGMDLRFFYGEYLKFMRDLLIVKSLENSDKLHGLNPENIGRIKDLLKNISDLEMIRYFNTLKEMEQTIRNTENPLVMTEFLFLKLSYFPSLVPIEEMIRSFKAGGDRPKVLASAPVHESVRTDEPPPATISDQEALERLRSKLEASRPRLAAILPSLKIEWKEKCLSIEVPGNMEHALKMVKEQKDHLRQIANEISGLEVRVDIALGEKNLENTEGAKIEKLRGDKVISSLRESIKLKLVGVENTNGGKNE